MLNIKENKTLEEDTAKTLCCKCKQMFCHGQHCFILSQSCRNPSFIVLSATWGISLSHQWHFQVELIALQHLWGQPTAVEVSLMLGKDQVSVSFRTRNGFCAPICHRGLRKNKALPGNYQNLWMRWHRFVSLPGDFWKIGKINCSWQREDTTFGPKQEHSALQVLENASALTAFLWAFHPGPLCHWCYHCRRVSLLHLKGAKYIKIHQKKFKFWVMRGIFGVRACREYLRQQCS